MAALILRQRPEAGDLSELIALPERGSAAERLRVYARDTKPLLDYYRARQALRSIDGSQSPDRVTAELAAIVDGLNGGTLS